MNKDKPLNLNVSIEDPVIDHLFQLKRIFKNLFKEKRRDNKAIFYLQEIALLLSIAMINLSQETSLKIIGWTVMIGLIIISIVGLIEIYFNSKNYFKELNEFTEGQ